MLWTIPKEKTMSKAKVELPDGTKVEIEAGTDVIVEIISGLLGPRYNPGTPAAPTKKADTAAPAEEPAVEEETSTEEAEPKKTRGRTKAIAQPLKKKRGAKSAKSVKTAKSKAKPKAKPKKSSKTTSQTSNMTSGEAIEMLDAENYFVSKRTIPEIREELAKRGHEFQGRQLFPVLISYTNKKSFTRAKDSQGIWSYKSKRK
tara:strand:- start:10057 stop:10662 length:606 start_codon:yes stop_codon:yes gene_type:complete